MRAIFLFLKLVVSLVVIKLRSPSYLRNKPISLKKLVMGPLALSRFIKITRHFIRFTTTSKQQREIIYWFFQMSSLIEKGFGDKNNPTVLTPVNFPNVLTLKDTKNSKALISELTDTICHIKKLTLNNHNYNNFESNIIKTWQTHDVRDVQQTSDKVISFDDALKAAENRGGSFFLALVYLLNPINLNESYKRLIRLSGAWFQIIDDYDDREKDVGNRNTPFTVPSNNSHKEIRKKYMAKYQKQIQTTVSYRAHPLIIFSLLTFFRGLAGLVTMKPMILGRKSDWHN